MGVFDASTPAGSDLVSQGDDRLRELKSALAEALSHEDSTFPGATPGSTPIFIPGFLRGATGSRPTGDSLVSGRLYINTTLGIIERYNGSSWDTVANYFAAGTKMVFYQASAPTGWTAEAVNDKFLRVVSSGGTGGTTGGSVAASTSLAHTHTLAHTHDLANHTHTGPSHTHSVPFNGWNNSSGISPQVGYLPVYNSTSNITNATSSQADNTSGAGGTGNTGAPSSNTSGAASSETTSSTFAGAFAYADVIIATKD